MRQTKTFVSFDHRHDEDLLHDLLVESRLPDSPFVVEDWSIHADLHGDWEKKVHERMRQMELLIVLCGEHTGDAMGVTAELWIAQQERIAYALLAGRADRPCQKPSGAQPHDMLYDWTWVNLKALARGSR